MLLQERLLGALGAGQLLAALSASIVGVTPAMTPVSVVSCLVSTWRQAAPAASDRSDLRPAWIGGHGGDAWLDPRRSPGVQRT